MEANLSSGNAMGGPAYGGVDLQRSMRLDPHQHPHSLQQHHHSQNHHGSTMALPHMHDAFSLSMGKMHESDKPNTMVDFNKGDRGKHSASDDDEPDLNEDGTDGLNDQGKGKRIPHWHRVKWTDAMVRLLITAVSYISEDALSECGSGGRRKYANLQKKGKWKSISKVMAERGFYVSPQQCEDKFNDLNKRYKKLNDILGRGTCCQVVENPALLELMDHLPEKTKEEVRKIMSSKHLFYEEMCSYHNGNRLHLPHDPAIQHSLLQALRCRDDHETTDSKRHANDDNDDDDQDADAEDHREEYEDDRSRVTYSAGSDSAKRMKQALEDSCFGHAPISLDNKSHYHQPRSPYHERIHAFLEGSNSKSVWVPDQRLKSRALNLEEQKLQLELQSLELEKERLQWQKFSKKKDREIERLKLENERMKLENERMALGLKQMEMSLKHNQ